MGKLEHVPESQQERDFEAQPVVGPGAEGQEYEVGPENEGIPAGADRPPQPRAGGDTTNPGAAEHGGEPAVPTPDEPDPKITTLNEAR